MILRVPDFYNRFVCIASRCTDTCCVGWEIDVDKVSQQVYRCINGPFGKKLAENIVDGHFRLLIGDRCPFLDAQNLCEMYRELGKDALCDICREHPRFVNVYGDVMERGLGLCCEEAVRLLLSGKEPLVFVLAETDEFPDVISNNDRKIRDETLGRRDAFLQILAERSMPFVERLFHVFGVKISAENAQQTAAFSVKLLQKTESYGLSWDVALKAMQKSLEVGNVKDQGCFTETESERLLSYFIFRHYANCLFEGKEKGKLRFALFFWNVLRFFTRELSAGPGDAKVNAVKLLSKQLEYSAKNMQLLESALDV